MGCNCKDCFNCPYPDCIADEKEIASMPAITVKRNYRPYYEANKEELRKKALARYYANHEENKRKNRESYHRRKAERLTNGK